MKKLIILILFLSVLAFASTPTRYHTVADMYYYTVTARINGGIVSITNSRGGTDRYEILTKERDKTGLANIMMEDRRNYGKSDHNAVFVIAITGLYSLYLNRDFYMLQPI